ncbi:MFS transporter [Streptomyces radicis]|uniref:MFS transporter n=2 Tax=Streptomyces radicis TaxID=1750517 RepID=A0A3A9WMP5_9ACTN|nr:MFS transporter [Streptomyces radicis]RKN19620.1 MFS transporter [Streptomyces radicis]
MLILSIDLTVLFFALPTLSADLEPSASQTLWIVHVYGFLIAGFLVTMGRLGDRVGPRRLLLVGAAAFGALSVVAAFAGSAELLIAARALLGVAGATLMPSLFSLLRVMFRDEGQRRLAIAIMFSAFSVGGALGPLLGGFLLEHFWWGAVFLINVPPVVALLLCGPRLLPERPERTTAPLDPVSVALSVAGVLGVVHGLQEIAAGHESGAQDAGAIGSNLAVMGAGILLLAAFVHRQRRLRAPLFDLGLLADPRVGAALATLLLIGIGVVGTFYLFTQYLQWAVGLSPLRAGLWTLPYIVLNVVGAMLAPALSARLRQGAVIVAGLAVAALGMTLLLALADPDTPLALLIGALSVTALGQGAGTALISDLIISGAPSEQTGSAAAAQEVSGELGTALGVAAGGAVGTLVYRAALPDDLPPEVPDTAVAAARASVHEGVSTAERLDTGGPALLDAVHEAVAQGLRMFAGVGAGLTALAAVLIAVVVARRRAGSGG